MQIDEKVYQNYLVEFAMYYNGFLLQIDCQINYQDELFGKNLDVVQHAFDMALIEFEISHNNDYIIQDSTDGLRPSVRQSTSVHDKV